MFRRGWFAALVVSVGTLATLYGCATNAAEESSSDDSALSGTVTEERACAVEHAYERASLANIQPFDLDTAPAGLRNRLAEHGFVDARISTMTVAGVGPVYIVETDWDGGEGTMWFFDQYGRRLVTRVPGWVSIFPIPQWVMPGGALACGGGSSDTSPPGVTPPATPPGPWNSDGGYGHSDAGSHWTPPAPWTPDGGYGYYDGGSSPW